MYTHFSVRLPAPENQERFLLNPFGLMFDEVRASDLIVVDTLGHMVQGNAAYNPAVFTIHSAVHMARDDARCVIHTHSWHAVSPTTRLLRYRVRRRLIHSSAPCRM